MLESSDILNTAPDIIPDVLPAAILDQMREWQSEADEREANARRILRRCYGATLRKQTFGWLIDNGREKACCSTMDDVYERLAEWAHMAAQMDLLKYLSQFIKNGGTIEDWRDVLDVALQNAGEE